LADSLIDALLGSDRQNRRIAVVGGVGVLRHPEGRRSDYRGISVGRRNDEMQIRWLVDETKNETMLRRRQAAN